ncbi:MAG: transporter, family, shikimate and dehydroshikimate transport protein [Methylobacteriaceae bacterium]|nr:transporter, family, shikimate and dehydroshikimate transport protein [Methylobacteriaceae bacterium]
MSTASDAMHLPPGAFVPPRNQAMGSVVFAGTIGTIIEWYDFLIYGTAAALVFNTLFFPKFDPVTGTIAALGTYAAGFFARPIGAWIFGHYGDRIGRKKMLILTMIITALGTFAIGLMPTYNQIGVFAPILLIVLRILQGIGLGGEWGGASLMVLEHAPANRRGFYGSLVQVGFPLGVAASTSAFALAALLPQADLMTWGWRLPFLFSVVLLGVGLYVRTRVPETPLFTAMKQRGDIAKAPFLDVVLRQKKTFLLAIGLKISEVSWVYIVTVFAVVYATTQLGLPKSTLLNAIIIGSLIEVFTIPLFGYLSDIVGRRALYFAGAIFTILFAFPLFWLIDTKNAFVIGATVAVALSFGHGMMFGLLSTYLPELFGTKVRYTGASLGFQVAAAIGGGLSPILATSLSSSFGGTAGVSLLLIMLASITLIATLCARETRDVAL